MSSNDDCKSEENFNMIASRKEENDVKNSSPQNLSLFLSERNTTKNNKSWGMQSPTPVGLSKRKCFMFQGQTVLS